MRAVLAVLLLPLLPLATLAPAASADPFCTYGEPGCEGVVCYTPQDVCVGDPCWFTCRSASAQPEPACERVYSGPGSSGDLCVDASDPKCAVYLETYHWELGTQRRCYLLP